MKGRQAAIQPGITHQCGKAIHALQQRRVTVDLCCILRSASQAHWLQRCFQGLGRQFGGTAPARHRCLSVHGAGAAESLHEAVVDPAFPPPEPTGWPELPEPASRPGPSRLVADQLQRQSLGAPGPERLIAAAGFQVAGEGASGANGPHAGGRPRGLAEDGAVPRCEQVVMPLHLQRSCRVDPSVVVHRQSTGFQPGGGAAAGAEQTGARAGVAAVDELDPGTEQQPPF